MATALQIINRALSILGVKSAGESISGDEASDMLFTFNSLLDTWSNDKQLNHYTLNETFTTTANVGTYSIGPQSKVITDNAGTFTAGAIGVTVNGTLHTEAFATDKDTTLTALAAALASKFSSSISAATYNSTAHTITLTASGYTRLVVTVDYSGITGTMTSAVSSSGSNWFDTIRPIRIDGVFTRDSGLLDTPLDCISNDLYQNIYDKSTTGDATYYNYVPSFPAGVLRIWPIPTTALTIGISQTPQFSHCNLTSDVLSLPPGYDGALAAALAYEAAADYSKDPSAYYKQMIDKIALLKTTNYEPMVLFCDSIGVPNNSYDIKSDR